MRYQAMRSPQRSWPLPTWLLVRSVSWFELQGGPQATRPAQRDHSLYPVQSLILELQLAMA